MIQPGSPLPDGTVWIEPDGDAVQITELVADGPVLLLFYLYDWTGT